jgi:hypothetical protein
MNIEYETKTGEFAHNEGYHGKSFQRWMPIIKEKTGIQVTLTADPAKSDTDFNKAENEQKTKPFIFALANLWKKYYYGFVVPNEEVLDELSSRLRRIIRKHDTGGRVFAGTTDLARAKLSFINVPAGNVDNFVIKFSNYIPPPLFILIKQNFKPIAGYNGPDKEDE